MYIQNRFAALIYRVALTAVCFYGLFLHTVKNGAITFSSYAYYTLLSNVACFLYFLPLTVKTAVEFKREGSHGATSLQPTLKGAVTMMITVTMVIYHFLLTPQQFSMGELVGLLTTANLLVHYMVPTMVVLDWLFFDPKGSYQVGDPLRWLAAPFAYLLFAVAWAQTGWRFPSGSRYPYFFIDVDELGLTGVGKWVVVISFFFLVLGYVYYFVDQTLAKKKDTGHHREKPVSV